jgi:putative hydrolase of the HAD superfamily
VRALLVDYGGVLTTSVFASFRSFCSVEGIEPDAIPHLLMEDEEAIRELHAFELGELPDAEFEERFAARLGVAPDGLLLRLFAGLEPDRAMIAAVRAAGQAGFRTALVSNSWGLAMYDRALLAGLVDVELISAEVRLRKPDHEIFRLAVDRLGVDPADCVMVDDLRPNVLAAEALGMRGILHRDAYETVDRLEAVLAVKLART